MEPKPVPSTSPVPPSPEAILPDLDSYDDINDSLNLDRDAESVLQTTAEVDSSADLKPVLHIPEVAGDLVPETESLLSATTRSFVLTESLNQIIDAAEKPIAKKSEAKKKENKKDKKLKTDEMSEETKKKCEEYIEFNQKKREYTCTSSRSFKSSSSAV
eukprot:TRINITY_DN39535_c0_g2_i1.p1 TRINITY_DN39535_c0_g2~~TRINITY_DN39535_c0_g2_i1.p1  ORF type:complete len:179 (-),score=46.64 TRINITY_DN39535_c0_g2_i1:20-496(-)